MVTESLIKTEDDFENLRYGNYEKREGFKVVEDEYIESRRWVELWRIVWTEDNGQRYFAYYYEVPSTELQDGSENEFDAARIYAVKPVSVMVTKYE